MKKADIILAILTGVGVAYLAYTTIGSFEVESVLGIDIKFFNLLLFLTVPPLAIFGLWLSYQIGKKLLFVPQLAKFLLIGALATLLDLWTFKGLGLVSGIDTNLARIVFKTVSFGGATFAKYWANKFLAFEKEEMAGAEKELAQFFIVTIISLGINVGIFAILMNVIGPQFGIPLSVWKTISVIGSAIIVFTWNFLGYKFIVFKK